MNKTALAALWLPGLGSCLGCFYCYTRVLYKLMKILSLSFWKRRRAKAQGREELARTSVIPGSQI